MVDVDLSFLFNNVFLLFQRFLNWHFTIYSHEIYVYAILGFVLLVFIFVQLLRLLSGVSID